MMITTIVFCKWSEFSDTTVMVVLWVKKEDPSPRMDQVLALWHDDYYPARALRALGLLLADGTPTGGRGEDFLSRQPDFFTETAVTLEQKVEKSFQRWEINRHVEG